jgi:hypothetical protein
LLEYSHSFFFVLELALHFESKKENFNLILATWLDQLADLLNILAGLLEVVDFEEGIG